MKMSYYVDEVTVVYWFKYLSVSRSKSERNHHKMYSNLHKPTFFSIVKDLKSLSNKSQAEIDKKYHKKGYKSYGLKIPQVKEVFQQYKHQIRKLSLNDRFLLAELFYKSGYAEEGRMGNAILALSVIDIKPDSYSIINKLLSYFNNWDEVDDFSINVTQPLLETYPKETLKLLSNWNKSDNTWKRRASVVAFVRKAGESGKYTKQVLSLCESLINDKEDLVQKGVGWALKDAMRGDRKAILNYVKNLRRRGVPSTITLYAIRDLKGTDRQQVLDVK